MKTAGLALAALLPLAALAQTVTPGQYAREDGAVTHRLELRADGTATAASQGADGKYVVITRFHWKVENDRLVQSRVTLQNPSGEFAARADMVLELRHVTADGFDTRARADLPWFTWRRQAWPK